MGLPFWRHCFNKVEYDMLKYKYLPIDEYKKFIKEIHLETKKKYILGSRDGFRLPENLGYLKIMKHLAPDGYLDRTQNKYKINRHSFDYIYRVKHIYSPVGKYYGGYFNRNKTVIDRQLLIDRAYYYKTPGDVRQDIHFIATNNLFDYDIL